MHRHPLSSQASNLQMTSSKTCSVAVAPPCFIGPSSSTRASITSVAGDVDRLRSVVHCADFVHQLLLSLGPCESVVPSFLFPFQVPLWIYTRKCVCHMWRCVAWKTQLFYCHSNLSAWSLTAPLRMGAPIAQHAAASRPTSHHPASFKL